MAKKNQTITGELVQFQPGNEVQVLPPSSGMMGQFLQDTASMFKARSMRIKTLFNKIDETGQRMEVKSRIAESQRICPCSYMAADETTGLLQFR